MGPVVGAVEAGISTAAVAAESVVTVAATTAAKTAEAGLAGAAQAGAAATEGAVQTVGTAVTETAKGIIPSVSEAVPGVVNAGVEGVAQEGLATGVETTLKASGPDAALNQIAETPTEANITPSVFAQEAVVTEQSAPVSPEEQITVQADSGITDEIRSDPLFQQKLEEERAAAQTRGGEIDDQKLSQEALVKYNQDKDSQAEQPQLTSEQQKIQQLEQKINGLVAENTELRNNTLK